MSAMEYLQEDVMRLLIRERHEAARAAARVRALVPRSPGPLARAAHGLWCALRALGRRAPAPTRPAPPTPAPPERALLARPHRWKLPC